MKRIIFALVAVGLAVSACSTSTEDATATYCDDLQTLETSLMDVRSSSTVEELQDNAKDASDDYDDVVASARDVENAVVDDIRAARDTFADAVDAIPSDATIGAAAQQISGAADTYVQTVGQTLASLNCSA